MNDDERKLLARCQKLPALRSRVDNGMVVVEQISDGKVTQFPSEDAALFYIGAYALVPSLLARIEELEKCSDPALVDRLVQDVAARRLENDKLAARVKMLEDRVAIEVNLRTKAQVRVRNALKVLAKLAEAAKRADALEGELAKAREERDRQHKENEAAAKAIAALEDIGEQARTYIDVLADTLRKAVKMATGYAPATYDDLVKLLKVIR